MSRLSTSDRFWSKVEKTPTCWLWTAGKIYEGYGMFWNGVRQVLAHRFAYEREVGPIPPGLQIDHLCRVRSCVNPAHMEVVTNRENVLRGKSPSVMMHWSGRCAMGHPFTDGHGSNRTSSRNCRICQKLYMRRYRAARIAERAA